MQPIHVMQFLGAQDTKMKIKHGMLICTMTAIKYGLTISYMQAKCKKSEVKCIRNANTKTYLTWTINAILHENA